MKAIDAPKLAKTIQKMKVALALGCSGNGAAAGPAGLVFA